MPAKLTANQFIKKLKLLRSAAHLKQIQRYFKSGAGEYGEGDKFIGVRMGQVFALAKEFIEMPAGRNRKATRQSDSRSPGGRLEHHGPAGKEPENAGGAPKGIVRPLHATS